MNKQQTDIERLRAQLLRLENKHQETAGELLMVKNKLNTMLFASENVKNIEPNVRQENTIVTQPEPTLAQATTEIPNKAKKKQNLESFIGENLLSKIGIVITIIGVSIGVKYSIEKDLLPPVLRVTLGYLFGGGLLATGLFLKKKYLNYSAVLVSGAMAILYFATYVAFSFYALFPVSIAFTLMVAFTALTVYWALRYNTVIIAHISLVGSYAVPFLLSTGSGKVHILLAYMAIINSGILFISFKKYWKSLFYASFVLTWLILGGWLATNFNVQKQLILASSYLSFFFLLFYGCALAYKARIKEVFNGGDVFLLLSNSFLFYGAGLFVLNESNLGAFTMGTFTLVNSLLHGVVSLVLWRLGKVDKKLLLFLSGLAVVYATITVPVYFNANWVTLLWASEACLLFYVGASQKQTLYLRLAYPLILLAFVSLLHDWVIGYGSISYISTTAYFTPVLNLYFLSTLVVFCCFALIVFFQKRYQNNIPISHSFHWLFYSLVPLLLIIISYIGLFLEIDLKWNLFQDQVIQSMYFVDAAQTLSLLSFGFLFWSILFLLNIKLIKSQPLAAFISIAAIIQVAVFLAIGHVYSIQLLQDYLAGTPFFGALNIGFRYIALSLVLLTLTLFQVQLSQKNLGNSFASVWQTAFHILIVLLLTSELVYWLEFNQVQNTLKLGLSILWGAYSLLLIAIGIAKNIKLLRILAIVLFAITLVKLFAYDLSSYNTISKTIVFVSLGILLLIISFLYNKNKGFLGEETEE